MVVCSCFVYFMSGMTKFLVHILAYLYQYSYYTYTASLFYYYIIALFFTVFTHISIIIFFNMNTFSYLDIIKLLSKVCMIDAWVT